VESGRKEETDAKVAEIVRIYPNFFLDRWTMTLVYKEQAEIDHRVDPLWKAG
jgi:hypothetical protein